MDLKLKEKVAIITGSGRGIGREIAMTLAREGARIAINDYYLDRAESVAEEIKNKGAEAVPIQADITQSEQVEQMVKKVMDTWGKVEILVNNAGLPAGLLETDPKLGMWKFLETERALWDRWIQLDIVGTLNCCRAVLEVMANQNYGKIVNIISDAGRIGEPGQVIYSGAKAAMVGSAKALAKEAARYRVNVNCVSASATNQTYTSERAGTESPTTTEQKERLQKIMKLYPLARSMGRLGLPSDIANVVAFLVSDVSEWITGQVLSVNGGYCMVD
jgi:2-hydroxycyclohexanecarboxyl-CoA dehydrogenase